MADAPVSMIDVWLADLRRAPKDTRPEIVGGAIADRSLEVWLYALGVDAREGWLTAARPLIGARAADSLARKVAERIAADKDVEAAEKLDRMVMAATEPIRIDQALAREDLPPLVTPGGWVIAPDRRLLMLVDRGEDGIVEIGVAHRPILVTGKLVDDETKDRSLHLEWPDERPDEPWGTAIVPAAETQDPRAFLGLRNRGAPVSGKNARDLGAWVDALEARNVAAIPVAHHTHRLGWQGPAVSPQTALKCGPWPEGIRGFLWGRALLTREGDVDSELAPSRWAKDHVRLAIPAGDGRRQLADGCAASGSLDGWREVVALALPYPRVMLGVYASLASCLLGPIPEAQNAIVDWSGETSRGKTTTLALAASCWGRPELTGAGLMRTWDVSPAALEQLASTCAHLPLILDDTKRATTRDDGSIVASLIYQLAAGQGRGRAYPDGMRATAIWRTILLSTGEAPATSFTQDAGARARVLAIRGSPFPEDSGAVVAEIAVGVRQHYGHAGPTLVRWLLAHPDSVSRIRADYADLCASWAERAGGGAVGGRLSAILALLALGATACHDILGVPRPDVDPLEEVALPAVVTGAVEADRPTAALRVLYAWACKHPSEFWGRHLVHSQQDDTPKQPTRGWAGAWQKGPMWTEIAFDPECLVRVLRHEGGFSADDVVPRWRERGWMRKGEGRNLDPKVTVDGERTRCNVITREAINAIDPE